MEPHQVTSNNIFELLPCDLQWYILNFLYLGDLYHISLTSQQGAYLVLSAEADLCVWKLMARSLGLSKTKVRVWRELVRSSMVKWDPKSRTSDTNILMHNDNRTISCERRSKWDTIRTSRKLGMGMVHCWEYTLESLDIKKLNSYRIFVGIERSTFAFTQVGRDKIIGLCSHGVSYNIGEHTIHMNHVRADVALCADYHAGDKIAIKLDLKSLSSSNTASMYLFRNNTYFHTISGIPTQGIIYYPAISVIGPHRVSIQMKHPYMFSLPS